MERRSFFGSIIAGFVALFSPRGWARPSRIKGRRVAFPRFDASPMPVLKLTDIKERRFDMIDRGTGVARWHEQEREETPESGRG